MSLLLLSMRLVLAHFDNERINCNNILKFNPCLHLNTKMEARAFTSFSYFIYLRIWQLTQKNNIENKCSALNLLALNPIIPAVSTDRAARISNPVFSPESLLLPNEIIIHSTLPRPLSCPCRQRVSIFHL